MSDGIDVGTAAVLGAVQGATEFLPISSDGHLALGAMLLGVSDEMPLSMVVLLHVGTLIATFIVFRGDVAAMLGAMVSGARDPRAWMASDPGRETLAILVASVPTAIIGLLLEDRVEAYSRVPAIVGLGFLGSAVVVASTKRGGGTREVLPLHYAFLVGIAQGLAVLPGLTRSGSTIAAAMLLGLSGPAAFRFSFLLSLPAVFGATLLQLRHYEEIARLGMSTVVGAAMALVVGLAALVWLRRLVSQGRFWAFALYLFPLGVGLIVWHFVSPSPS